MARKRVFVAALVVIVLVLLRTDRYFGTIYRGWDSQFYYSLARSILLDHDVDITNDLRSTPHPRPFDPKGDGSWSDAPTRPQGGIPTKYPLGLSLIELPWLAVGHAARPVVERLAGPLDGQPGYSRVEVGTVALGLALMTAWGLARLFELLAGEYGPTAAGIGVAAGWAGTSLFYYSAVFPLVTHAVSFTLLVLTMRRLARPPGPDDLNRVLAALGTLLALAYLVRPQQAFVALCALPLVIRWIAPHPVKRWLPGALLAGVTCALAVLAQLWMTHAQFGVWALSGYFVGHEGFTWLHPQFSFVLLSGSRGLLRFSPIVILAALGYLTTRPSTPAYAWPFVVNAIAQVYVIAAWSSPNQGDAFGARMWTDNAAVVAFGVSSLFARAPGPGRTAVVAATVACTTWTAWLMLRYMGILPGGI